MAEFQLFYLLFKTTFFTMARSSAYSCLLIVRKNVILMFEVEHMRSVEMSTMIIALNLHNTFRDMTIFLSYE